MSIVHEVSVAAGHAIQGIRAGAEKLASHKLCEGVAPSIEVQSVAFEHDAVLPISCTADGVGAAPAVAWQGAPESSKSFVVICEDPDAPLLEPFVHWLVYGIPASANEVDAQTQHDFRIGENSRSEAGFTPAAPPAGHGVHKYHFQVFALDTTIELGEGKDRDDVIELMNGHVLAWGEIVGTYERD